MGNTPFSPSADGSYPTPRQKRWFLSLAPTVPVQSSTIAHRLVFPPFFIQETLAIWDPVQFSLSTQARGHAKQNTFGGRCVIQKGPTCKFTITPAQKPSLCPKFDWFRGSRIVLTKLTKDLWVRSSATLLNYNKRNKTPEFKWSGKLPLP